MLDAAIQNVLHVGTPRIGDDAAIPQRARAPLGASLKPAENLSIGNDRSCALAYIFSVEFRHAKTVVSDRAGINRLTNFSMRKFWAPIRIAHRKRPGLSELLMPNIIGRTDREACIARGRLHKNLL